jgi:sugar lactone lactonase YvrE
LSADGESLFVAVSCSGDFEPSCVQGDVIFAKYSIGGLDNTEVTKVATFKHQFGKSTVGAADGLSFHADTGYLVSSCPLGLCIIDFSEEGKLLAHIKLGDKPVRTSNISFGKERGQQYAFVTGTEKVWKIKMMPIVQSDEL